MVFSEKSEAIPQIFSAALFEPILNLLRKTTPPSEHLTGEDITCAEIERLAETSPHLLRDIGFRQETSAPDQVTTWRRGGLRVERRHIPGAAYRAFREPRD